MIGKTVLRPGLLFGTLSGIFTLAVQLMAVYVIVAATMEVAMVGSILEFLIIGSAGRRAGGETRRTGPGIAVGALAGGISELIHSVGSAVVLLSLPGSRGAVLGRTSSGSADPLALAGLIVFRIALLIGFGALFGWLGAWSAVRFGSSERRE